MTVIRCTSPVTKGKRMGQPCGMPIAGNLPDGVPACAGHLARSGDPVAAAKLAANLSGSGARGKRSRARKAPTDPVGARIAELQRLAAVAEKRRDLQLAARYHEMIGELVAPHARAQAEAGTGPIAEVAPERIHIADLLRRLSDEELTALKLASAAFERALAAHRADEPAPPQHLPPPARPVTVTTNEEEPK